MSSQLFIPDKIKVGFQNREDTYTKKLAYVIYYDEKGKLRKEKSWESWRNKNIDPVEFDNTPTEGFVINRYGGGGGGSSWGYWERNAFIRVWDPRDFEFEIPLWNLLLILRECDISRGKGIEGNFVYSWAGTELVLLPEGSEDYRNSSKYTALQSQKISLKELVEGYSYETKDQKVLVYLGRFFKHFKESWRGDDRKYYRVFYDGKNFVFLRDSKTLARLHSDTIASNYAELVDKYNKSQYGSKPVGIILKTLDKPRKRYGCDNWTYEKSSGIYIQVNHHNHNKYIRIDYEIRFEDGIQSNHVGKYLYSDRSNIGYYGSYDSKDGELFQKLMSCKNQRLFAQMESGSEIEIIGNSYLEGE